MWMSIYVYFIVWMAGANAGKKFGGGEGVEKMYININIILFIIICRSGSLFVVPDISERV